MRIAVKHRTRIYYLRWYYEGWHYWAFRGAAETLTTTALDLKYTIQLGDDQLTKRQLNAISGLLGSKYIHLLTDDGWKQCTMNPTTFGFGSSNNIGANVTFALNVWAKVGAFTPLVLPDILPPPMLYISKYAMSFTAKQGMPSDVQTYTIKGENIISNVQINAPTGWEISSDNAAWVTGITISPIGGVVSERTIYVRMNSATVGQNNGFIANTTTGINKNIVVNGVVSEVALFITEWTIPAGSFTIPAGDIGVYDAMIDFGDGSELKSVKSFDDANLTHTYAASGDYTIKIYGQFPWLRINNGVVKDMLKDVSQWGSNKWQSCIVMFFGCSNLAGFSATDVPDLSECADMSLMFYRASSFNQDISGWDVSNVTNMSYMFFNTSSFNGDISGWDVSSVTNMQSMFFNTSSFNGDISGWNVSKVTNMQSMFHTATSFNQDISGWNVSKVTNMQSMFHTATSFNGDISNWDMSKVTNMSYMFGYATSFNQDISSWNVSKVTNMSYMFKNATAFNSDISGWDVSNVADMSVMFHTATSFNQDISGWNVSKVTNMQSMFHTATSFNGDISNWNVSKVTNMSYMFGYATSFNGDISNWNVSDVTNMSAMFAGATSFNGDISNWDVSNVADMSVMFEGATSFNQDLSQWCVRKILSPPIYFAAGSALTPANYPVWGTCPRNEDGLN